MVVRQQAAPASTHAFAPLGVGPGGRQVLEEHLEERGSEDRIWSLRDLAAVMPAGDGAPRGFDKLSLSGGGLPLGVSGVVLGSCR